MSRRLICAALMAAVLTGAGCTSDSGSGADTSDRRSFPSTTVPEMLPTIAPASGSTITGTGYTYRAPRGWGPPPEQMPGFDVDSSARDALSGRFANNVFVVLTPAEGFTLDELEQAAIDDFEANGADFPFVHPPIEIDGVRAVHVSAGITLNDLKTVTEQFYVLRGDDLYVITFSFAHDFSADERATAIASMLVSWTWQD